MKRWAWVVLMLLLALGGPVFSAPQDAVPLLTYTVATRQQVEQIVATGLDVSAVRRVGAAVYEVDVVGHREDRAALAALPFASRVRIADLLARAAAVSADYRQLEDYEADMQDIANTYPQLAKRRVIGTSVEGRNIYGLEMTSRVSKEDGRAETAFMGLHHSREWPTGEVVIMLAYDLAQKYGTDPRITTLLNTTRVWLIPVVNPDGFNYSRRTYPMWRKNRRNNGDGTFGVDNNRNYAYQWGGPGSSGFTGSETYRGPSQVSEPETEAIQDLFLSRHITTALSNHTYSNLILWPWGYKPDNNPEYAAFDTMGRAMAAFNGYTQGPIWHTIYPASGVTDDWVYGTLAGFSFTFEIGCCEFHPPYSQIQGFYNLNYPAFLYLAEQARPKSSILKGIITDETTGDGIRATLTLSRDYQVPRYGGGFHNETKSTELRSKRSGKYTWRVLPSKMPEGSDPGYTLRVSAPGYQTETVNVKIGRQQTKTVNVALTPATH